MQAQTKSKDHGFTLLELLVVIAVILVLASLLFPALSSMRETGRSTRCKSNLRQIQIATVQYTINSGGNLPFSTSSNYLDSVGAWQHNTGWLEWGNYTPPPVSATPGNYDPIQMACITNGSLFAYTHSAGIYACPSAILKTPTKVWTYSMNYYVSGASFINNSSPANTLLFGDSTVALTAGSYTAQFDPINTNISLRAKNPGQLWSGHGGNKAATAVLNANAVFLDGHVESF